MTAGPPPLIPPPPRFSRRIWTGDVYGGAVELGQPLTIYVEAFRATYEEDWETEVRAWQRSRAFMSRCYSVVEPEGEIGFTPLSEVEEISEEEFRGALAALRVRGWPTSRGDA